MTDFVYVPPRFSLAGTATPAVRGMLCMIAAMLLLPLGDSLAKLLTRAVHPIEVTMWRLAAQSVCLVPVAIVLRRRLRGSILSPVIMLSGALLAISLSALISAFAVMPLATAIAIFFVEPLLLTLLAGPLLGEVPGRRRLIAVGIGLTGALIVIRPGFSTYGWVTILPLISALAYALNMIVLRKACETRSGLTVQCGAALYAGVIVAVVALAAHLVGALTLTPAAIPAWGWGAVLGAGVLAAVSFVLIAQAFRMAEASSLASFQYLEILGALGVGYLLFGDLPDAMTWLGVLIILASGLYVFHREGHADTDTRAPRRRRTTR
ncbi:drug/metabolite transporter (DMT)-like permease [Sagittula marina]|uniref:Drug/metabolite transporter (DMT)-like permease n=1 Tax=Sagittula marina TaxID=943940 RepID=A0A7W6DRC7_9RHOB|nr:drug/metabolite transporter (DMT)-like permease [Sagittula marina]